MARVNVLVVYNVLLTEHTRDNISSYKFVFIICYDVTSPSSHKRIKADNPFITSIMEGPSLEMGPPIRFLSWTESISVDRIERCPHTRTLIQSGQLRAEILGPEIIWQAAAVAEEEGT